MKTGAITLRPRSPAVFLRHMRWQLLLAEAEIVAPGRRAAPRLRRDSAEDSPAER